VNDSAVCSRDEHGQVAVFFALLLPVLFGLSAIVIGIGNWYTHAKHLQTKADAGAFAAGSVWSFPCGPPGGNVDQRIETAARTYLGPHTKADNTLYVGTTFNAQVGGVGESDIHAVLNGPLWFDDDSTPSPTEFSDPSDPSGSLCETKILDVKLTEDNSFPLASLIPLYPDIKRKARIEIDKITGLRGLLPISVRVPKPRSAAAVFYDETTGNILPNGVRYFCEVAGLGGMPAGLGAWTTYDPTNPLCDQLVQINGSTMPPNTGVAIATSFRPPCSASVTTNCFEDTGFATVNDLCRQGSNQRVECFYDEDVTDGVPTVASGLQFIHGYPTTPAVTDGPPVLREAWLQGGGCTGGYGSGYFASVNGTCAAVLNVSMDAGTCMRGPGQCFADPGTTPPVETRIADNVELKYTLVTGTGNNDDICDFGPTCDLNVTGTQNIGGTVGLAFDPNQARYAMALRVRLKETFVPGKPNCSNTNYNGQCEWYFTGNGRQDTQPSNAFILAHPVQRSFMGDDDRSGPIKFLRLTQDRDCSPATLGDIHQDNEAGNQPNSQNWCYYVEMGLKGAIALDQDEPPIAFNLKASQSASLDCDPNIPNLKDEVVEGCKSVDYATNDFARNPPCPNLTNWTQIQSPPAPYDAEWPPITCVLTQTGNPTQLIDGFLERFFGDSSSPLCPPEGGGPAPEFVPGRNYWHDANNSNDNDKFTFAETIPTNVHGDGTGTGGPDPRKILLFMTGFGSFGGSGNALFPIVNFGTFYVTGIGRGRPGGGVDVIDPCDQGNGNTSPGAGNKPPPDLKTEPGGAYIWGHFISNVVPSPGAIGSNELCEPELDFQPCVPVLVE
jgi:hypothetical protein